VSNGQLEGLAKVLGRSGLEEDHVRELVDVVAQFEGAGQRIKAFPKGQFAPDAVEIQAVFDRDGLQSLLKVLGESPRIDSVEIFPRGIINPEIFSARIGLR
jgi:hypothetical protein